MFPRYLSITISIPAPTEGATMATAALWKRRKFQSTLPRRERHAFRHSIIYYIQYFNPRSRGGSDLNDFLVALFSGVFQSTLPRRERRRENRLAQFSSYFNPRSRGGSDAENASSNSGNRHFNPRSRGGSDPVSIFLMPVLFHFNPRSRGGSDLISTYATCTTYISIHAPAEGATDLSRNPDNYKTFQSTLPRRERHQLDEIIISLIVFQSTLPRRERQQTYTIFSE